VSSDRRLGVPRAWIQVQRNWSVYRERAIRFRNVDIVPGQQTSSMMVTTVDDGVSRKTRFDLFCQTR
jgi:hypothetical protein